MNNKSKNSSKIRVEWSGKWVEYLYEGGSKDSITVCERQVVWPVFGTKKETKIVIVGGG